MDASSRQDDARPGRTSWQRVPLRLGAMLLVGLVCATLPAIALAGLLKVSVDAGTMATVTVTDFGKNQNDPAVPRAPVTATDANQDKTIEFSLDPEFDIANVVIEKVTDGRKIKYTLTFKQINQGGVTIASLEPFQVPTFSDANGALLVATLNTAEFLSQNLLFTSGQLLSVINGSILASSEITFFNETGSLFTGTAIVASFDQFLSVAEPGVLGLLMLGGLAAFARSAARTRIHKVVPVAR